MIASERLRALVRYNIYNDFINDILDDNQYRFYLDILLDIADKYNLDEIKDKYHTITQIIKWFRMNMAVELPELDNFSVAYLVGNELESGFYTMNDKGLWIKTQLRFSYPLTFTQGINITEYIYKARTYDSKFYLIQISGPICAVISKEGIVADLILHPRIDNLSDDIYFKEKLVNVIEEIWYLIKYNKNIGDNNETK